MNRRNSWLWSSLPFALCLAMGMAQGAGAAAAQDSGITVVPKTMPTNTIPSGSQATAAGILPANAGTQASSAATATTANGLKPAQDLKSEGIPPNKMPPPPPVEASIPAGSINNTSADQGAGWQAAVQAAPGPTPLLGAAQTEAVTEIDDYFNGLTSIQGTFTQVDSDRKVSTGRFYVQRPGKLRFDYAPPSPLQIISDGSYLSVVDSSLKTIERYPISSTPFRLLVAKKVDLERDAQILGVARDSNELSIDLEDKSDPASGSIRLVFDTKPKLKLDRWVITDAQGLTTKVTLDTVKPGGKVAVDFFQSRESFSPFR